MLSENIRRSGLLGRPLLLPKEQSRDEIFIGWIMKILIVLALSVLCGVLYRMGGAAGYITIFRDLGCAACMVASIVILFGIVSPVWWADVGSLIVVFAATWGALSTYRYFFKKPENYTCWYYLMHGFFVALAIMPWAYVSGHLLSAGVRCIVCAGLVGIWSGLMKNPKWEELGRGFIMNSSILLLLLF